MRPAQRVADAISRLPRVGYGTVPLGNLYTPVAEQDAAAALAAAWAGGMRWFDTAPVYGMGLAESRLGAAMCTWPRDDVLLSSKVGRVLERGIPLDPSLAPNGQPFYITDDAWNPVFDYSAAGVDRSLEQSFARLGADRLDLVFVHDPDSHIDQVAGETVPHLAELREQGVVGAIGIGMTNTPAAIELVRRTPLDVVMIAGRYSLLDTEAGWELLPECHRRGVAVIVGGVFNSGILAGAETFDYVAASPEVVERVTRIASVCASFEVPLPAAAIAFPLRSPAVAAVVLGMRSADEVRANLALARTPIPDALWDALAEEDLIPNLPKLEP